jgi:collagenase-like protein with putative collagen-binding domain
MALNKTFDYMMVRLIAEFACKDTDDYIMPQHPFKKSLATALIAAAVMLTGWWCLHDIVPSPFTPPEAQAAATGPLRVLASNPRYFTDGSVQAIYLTGSHTWCNLSNYYFPGNDETCTLDWSAYLTFLTQHHHNFIRMWTFELLGMAILPWQRSGPGTAHDGKPKVNFTQWNQAYFDRLRSRVMDARDRGMYVSIMLFDGAFSQDQWDDHLMNPANNGQGIDGRGSATHTLGDAARVAIQEAYGKKVIDTVNDLDNVLYEISNESRGSSDAWQYHMITLIKTYEAGKPKQHPVGMTITDSMAALLNSPADWISPGAERWQDYRDNPPPNDGRKVILADTDHIGTGSAANVTTMWKNFSRGNQAILMDEPFQASNNYKGGARIAMGDTRRYADTMNLAAMSPRGDLTSTGYALANPGSEYLVYNPDGGPFTVNLQSATYQVQWFNPSTRQILSGGSVSGGGSQLFSPPFSGEAVLYLKGPGAESSPTPTPTQSQSPTPSPQGIFCATRLPGTSSIQGFGTPWDVFNLSELLLKAYCNGNQTTAVLGPSTYVYYQGYAWVNNQWQQTTFNCTGGQPVSGVWCPTSAQGQLPNNSTYYVGYTCNWTGTKWNCGCADQACTTNSWQLQKIN